MSLAPKCVGPIASWHVPYPSFWDVAEGKPCSPLFQGFGPERKNPRIAWYVSPSHHRGDVCCVVSDLSQLGGPRLKTDFNGCHGRARYLARGDNMEVPSTQLKGEPIRHK